MIMNLFYIDVHFVNLLQHRFIRQAQASTNNMQDIYDGEIYREKATFFSSRFNISFTLNYDGAPKFKSSNMQIWPIQLSINELPPLAR